MKPLPAGVIFAHRREIPDIGEAMLEIKSAQQVAIGLKPIGIVNVGGLEEQSQLLTEVLITSFRREPNRSGYRRN